MAWGKTVEEGLYLVLKRRAKRRYLSIMHSGAAADAVDVIMKRCSELFGSIATENAAMRLVKSEERVMIVKCQLDRLDEILVASALSNPPLVALDMSGSIRKLQRRLR